MRDLTFRSDDHTYWLEGRRLPAVSDIIQPLANFAGIPAATLERKRQLGTDVHYACDLDDDGELDDYRTDAEVLSYVIAWRAFKRDAGFSVVLKEHRLHHSVLEFAGTLDRIGDTREGERMLIDLKTSVYLMPAVGVQIAGYQMLIESNFPLHTGRVPMYHGQITRKGLQLRPDGSYRLVAYDDPNDRACFLSLLNVLNWRTTHGCTK